MNLYFHTAEDEVVWRVEDALRERIDGHCWMDGKELQRWIAREHRLSMRHAGEVLMDLYRQGVLIANYGQFKIAPGVRPEG